MHVYISGANIHNADHRESEGKDRSRKVLWLFAGARDTQRGRLKDIKDVLGVRLSLYIVAGANLSRVWKSCKVTPPYYIHTPLYTYSYIYLYIKYGREWSISPTDLTGIFYSMLLHST